MFLILCGLGPTWAVASEWGRRMSERETCPVLQQFVLIYKRISSPCLRHEGIYASGEVQLYPFLTSPLDGKRPVSRAGRFTPGKTPLNI